jgi:hypothetical protein
MATVSATVHFYPVLRTNQQQQMISNLFFSFTRQFMEWKAWWGALTARTPTGRTVPRPGRARTREKRRCHRLCFVEVSLDWFLFRGSRCRVDHVLAAGGAFCCSSSLVAGLLDMKWLLEVQGSFGNRNANLFHVFDSGQELVWL